jgi:hypothetical protein
LNRGQAEQLPKGEQPGLGGGLGDQVAQRQPPQTLGQQHVLFQFRVVVHRIQREILERQAAISLIRRYAIQGDDDRNRGSAGVVDGDFCG